MSTNFINTPKCQNRDNPFGGFRPNTSGRMDRRTLHDEISNFTFAAFYCERAEKRHLGIRFIDLADEEMCDYRENSTA